MVTAARTRPVRIAPRMAVTAKALDTVAPGCGQRDDEAAAAAAES